MSVGGGSCIDAAKTLLYFYQQDKGGRTPYQIAIPTTLSAAEYQVGVTMRLTSTIDQVSRLVQGIQTSKATRSLSAPTRSFLQESFLMQN